MAMSEAVLVQAAREAARNAYAPYSGYGVGAAILLVDDRIISGCNLENASYGMTLCAEAVALGSANAEGAMQRIVAIAVAGGLLGADGAIHGDTVCHPCGRCRQMINEVATLTDRDLPIWCASAEGDVVETYTIKQLLPQGFGPLHLPETE
jgi:cytidine deaminase